MGKNPKVAMRFRRQEHIDKITVYVDTDFAGGPIGIGGSDRESHREIWIHSSELDSFKRERSGVLGSGEKRSVWTTFETL